MTIDGIGYTDIENEIVDDNKEKEKELIDAINDVQEENNKLADNCLEKLNKDQLAIFLTKNYFEGQTKNYAECKKTGDYLNFSMKAALQLLYCNDTTEYDNNLNEVNAGTGKTINNLISENGGIDLDYDTTLIKILQKKVGAYPDGKAGPQTISLVISALGGDISNIYEGVNNLYSNNEKFRIQNISEFEIGNTNYKYDKNQFSLMFADGKRYLTVAGDTEERQEINIDDNGNPSLEGFSFENGWIKIKKGGEKNDNNQSHETDQNQGVEEEKSEEDVKKDIEYLNRLYSNCDVFAVKEGKNWQYLAFDKSNNSIYYKSNKINENSGRGNPLGSSLAADGIGFDGINKSMGVSGVFAGYDIKFLQVKSLIENESSDIDLQDNSLLQMADLYFPNKSGWREKNRRKLAKWGLSNDDRGGRKFFDRGKTIKEKGLSEEKISLKSRMILNNINVDKIIC